MRSRGPSTIEAAEYRETCADEAAVLETFRQYAERVHGVFWHLPKNTRGAVEGIPDIRLLVPCVDPRHVVAVDLEVKVKDDPIRPAQAIVLDYLARVDRMINGIIRVGRLREGEMTETEALARIEEARGWE